MAQSARRSIKERVSVKGTGLHTGATTIAELDALWEEAKEDARREAEDGSSAMRLLPHIEQAKDDQALDETQGQHDA